MFDVLGWVDEEQFGGLYIYIPGKTPTVTDRGHSSQLRRSIAEKRKKALEINPSLRHNLKRLHCLI